MNNINQTLDAKYLLMDGILACSYFHYSINTFQTSHYLGLNEDELLGLPKNLLYL
jgi:hypothetical protein